MKDVTSEYMKTCDIMIPTQKKRNHKHAYLAVFRQSEMGTYMLRYTKRKSFVYFNEIGKDIAYLPLYYDNQGIHPITDPFILDSRGRIKYLHADTSKRKKVILSRKYYLAKHIFRLCKNSHRRTFLKLPIIRISPILIQYIRFLIGYCPQILSR